MSIPVIPGEGKRAEYRSRETTSGSDLTSPRIATALAHHQSFTMTFQYIEMHQQDLASLRAYNTWTCSKLKSVLKIEETTAGAE